MEMEFFICLEGADSRMHDFWKAAKAGGQINFGVGINGTITKVVHQATGVRLHIQTNADVEQLRACLPKNWREILNSQG
jgi:hypothetical protein